MNPTKTPAALSWEQWGASIFGYLFKSLQDPRSLSRLSSSRRVLEAVSGIPARDAQHEFIRSFGHHRRLILAKYNHSGGVPVDSALRTPPRFFSSLYLSLLAAGADEDTNQVGDFRRRFCMMINAAWETEVFEEGQLTNAFGNLPGMWLYVKNWLERNESNGEGWCQLVLPKPPSHERLIGISKRLAFPSYRDEIKIRQILLQHDLDAGALPDQVEKVFSRQIYNYHSGLTQNCIDEFRGFSTLLKDSSLLKVDEALQTPFWGAVSDVSLSLSDQNSSKRSEYCLSISTDDPSGFEAYLLSSSESEDGSNFYSDIFSHKGRYKFRSISTGVENTLDLLGRLYKSDRRNFQLKRMKESLEVGFLSLYVDDEGRVNTDAKFSGQAREVFFLVSELLRAKLKALGVQRFKPKEIRELGDSNGWGLLHFVDLDSADRMQLFRMLPEEVSVGVRFYSDTQMQVLRDGVRLRGTSAFVVNRFSCERFCVHEAASGTWRCLGSNEAQQERSLEQRGPGAFGLPLDFKALNKHDQQVETLVLLPNGRQLRKKIRCFSYAPYSCRPKFLDRNVVVDGDGGHLMNEAETYECQECCKSGEGAYQYEPVPLKPRDFQVLDELKGPAEEIIEVLCARFESTVRIDRSELRHYGKEASHLGVSLVNNLMLRLHNSALIKRVTSFGENSFDSLAAERRLVSEHKEGLLHRYIVSGLLNRNEREELCRWLTAKRCTVEAEQEYVLEGITPLSFVSAVPMDYPDLEETFSLQRVDLTAANPFRGFSRSTFLASRTDRFSGGELEFWDAQRFAWVSSASLNAVGARLARSQSRYSTEYYLLSAAETYRTNSRIWAFMWLCYLTHGYVAEISPNFELRWHRSIRGLPPIVVNWWIHFLGGSVTATSDGQLVMRGCRYRARLRKFLIQAGLAIEDSSFNTLALRRWRHGMLNSHRRNLDLLV